MNKGQLKLKTKQEQKTMAKVLDELAILIEFLDIFPKKGKKHQRGWSKGFIYGTKYIVIRIAQMLGNKNTLKKYKSLIDWEDEQKQLIGDDYVTRPQYLHKNRRNRQKY